VFRPTGFADLAGKRVGIFGFGIEGAASAARVRDVASSVVLVDDAPSDNPDVLVTSEGGHEQLLTCDVVLKSPGIPRRRLDVTDLEDHGVVVTSALNLWLHDVDRSRVIAITGTKGKSTTTALIAFFLECLGEAAQQLGNIGQPPYDPAIDSSTGWLVLEVSSFQCVDIDVAPSLVLVTSLGADHLDWHGSLEDYHRDKLSLTRVPGPHATLVPDTVTFRDRAGQLGGDVTYVEADSLNLATSLGLLGAHSDSNVALALATVAKLMGTPIDDVRRLVREKASSFVPLRGRLTLIATEGNGVNSIRYVDDGLATAALPTVAALEVFTNTPVALIVGGFDRGVDYSTLAATLGAREDPTFLITMGDAGRRIGVAAFQVAPTLGQVDAPSMRDAVTTARELVKGGGVVLFSPGAPSFDRYRNWEERSDDFTAVVRELTK
jgi:UDP-N-acetylmuramoylalanine--D-glutamate ligase